MSEYNEVDGAAMLASVCFARTDLAHGPNKARGEWMLQVIRFMRVRGWITAKWISISGHALDGGKLKSMPQPWPGLDPGKDILSSEGLQDLYHSATMCKVTFDKFARNIAKLARPKGIATREYTKWSDWKAAIDRAASSKKTAPTADIAALDAVPVAIVFQPLKTKERTSQKAKENYHGTVKEVKDIVRLSIVCEAEEDIVAILAKIKEITATYIPLDVGKRKGQGQLRCKNKKINVVPVGLEVGAQPGQLELVPTAEGPPGLPSPVAVADSGASVQSESSASDAVSGTYASAKAQREKEVARGMRVVSVKNRFKGATSNGYRDMLIIFAVDYIHEHEPEPGAHNQEPKLEVAQCYCELQIHQTTLLDYANSFSSHSFYSYFRTFFGSTVSSGDDCAFEKAAKNKQEGQEPTSVSRSPALAFQNKLKALKTMDQVGEFVEELEAAMQVYLGGVGRVGKDLARLSAYFQLFVRVGEVRLAEAMQACLVGQLRDQDRKRELYGELSTLSTYFKSLKRYRHAKPLSEEALALCELLNGPMHLETADQLTNHASLLHCCGELKDAMPIYARALDIKEGVCGRLSPITFYALDKLATVFFDEGNYRKSLKLYKRLLETHREIARKSRTGQAGPEVADALVQIAFIYEVYEEIQDFEKSYHFLKEAMAVYADFYTEEHESRAVVWEAMAGLKEQEGLLMDGLVLHREVLELRLKLFKDQAEYMGLDSNDPVTCPPLPTVADSYNSIGEILLDFDDVAGAMENFLEALRIREILAEPHYWPSASGEENSLLALATVQTNLAYALVQGPKRRHHHNNYYEARDVAKPAYAARMRYLGIRSTQTLETINVQGVIDELIIDYNAEKDRLKLEHKEKKAKEERAAARKLQREISAGFITGSAPAPRLRGAGGSSASLSKPVSRNASVNSLPRALSKAAAVTTTETGAGAEAGGPLQRVNTSGSISPNANEGNKRSAKCGNNSSSTGSISAKAVPISPPKIGQKLTEGTPNQNQEGSVKEEVPEEEEDTLAGHVHTKGVHDLTARQQLDEPVAKAHGMLETAERCRDLGEFKSALKCCKEACDVLRPDLALYEDASVTTGGEDGNSVVNPSSIAGSQVTHGSSVVSANPYARRSDRKQAYAIALSYYGSVQLDVGWYNNAVDSFQKSLDLIILTYGTSYVHRDIAQSLSNLAIALHLSERYDSAIEVNALARKQWLDIVRREGREIDEIAREEAEEDALACGMFDVESANELKEVEGGELEAAAVQASVGAFSRMSMSGNNLNDDENVGGGRNITNNRNESSDESKRKDSGANAEAWASPINPGLISQEQGSASSFIDGIEQVQETDEESMHGDPVDVDPYDDPDYFSFKHPDAHHIARIDHTLSLSFCGIGNFENAREVVLGSLGTMRAIHKADSHPDTIAVMNTRGLVEGYLGDYEASFATFNDILKFRSRVYGTSDPAFALGTNNYGGAMFMLDDHALAGRTWTESIELRERQVGIGSKAVSTSLYNMNALFVRSEKLEAGAAFVKGRGEVEKLLDVLYAEPEHNPVPSMDLLLRKPPSSEGDN